jgi:hypothetical protein
MILLAVYVGALIVGGGLLAASALLGGHGHDGGVEHEVAHEADHEADHEAEGEHDGDGDHVSAGDALWLPVLSVRFWTFFLAFFGLTGALLEGLRRVGLVGAPSPVVAVLAAVIGAGAGYAVSRLVHALKRERVSSEVVPESDYAGKAGEVLLDVAPGDPGLVRLDVKGVSIDLPAVAADGETPRMRRGCQVIVLAYAGGKVQVAPFDTGEPGAERPRERA